MALHKGKENAGLQVSKLLGELEFFSKFTDSEKQEFVSSENYIVKADPGTQIITQGTVDYSVYIILEGEVIVRKNEFPKVPIATLGRGSVCGAISFLSRGSRQTNIIAKDRVKLIKFNAETFESLNPITQVKLKEQFIEVLLDRVEGMNNSLIQLKVELDSIAQAGTQFKEDFQEIVKRGIGLEDVFDQIGKTIYKLIR